MYSHYLGPHCSNLWSIISCHLQSHRRKEKEIKTEKHTEKKRKSEAERQIEKKKTELDRQRDTEGYRERKKAR